eukprot:365013-Chlamydomonas_euryale.AAC.14
MTARCAVLPGRLPRSPVLVRRLTLSHTLRGAGRSAAARVSYCGGAAERRAGAGDGLPGTGVAGWDGKRRGTVTGCGGVHACAGEVLRGAGGGLRMCEARTRVVNVWTRACRPLVVMGVTAVVAVVGEERCSGSGSVNACASGAALQSQASDGHRTATMEGKQMGEGNKVTHHWSNGHVCV